jgi:hypothetical protein
VILSQELECEDETKSDNSNDKNGEERYTQEINKVILSQELECGKIKGDNSDETINFEQTHDFKENTNTEKSNTQLDSADKIVKVRRTSKRNKKKPTIRGNIFLW